jgi:hypothetical protein
MQAQTKLINKKAEEFLKEIKMLISENLTYKLDFFENIENSVLFCINRKLNITISIFNGSLSLTEFSEIVNGWWKNSEYSQPIGYYSDNWLIINWNTKEIEVHNPDYYYLDLYYKVALNEDLFLKVFLKAAQIIYNYGIERDSFDNNLIFGYNIYERRRLAEEFAIDAGGEIYFEFWKQFWTAWSDEEILEAGPLGYYNLDLPEGIISDGDKFVKVK